MRTVDVATIRDTVAKLCIEANTKLPEDVLAALRKAQSEEVSPLGRQVLGYILENAEVAAAEQSPLCQDTGYTLVYLDIGQDVHLAGGSLQEAVNAGVAAGYRQGYLRSSIIGRPLEGMNTGDNTPAIIHTEIVPGDRVRVLVVPKGAGCENMSALVMLKPAEGLAAAKRFILDTVAKAGPNACPPMVVGVGLGGTFDYVAHLAKLAILRPVGSRNADPRVAALEEELEEAARGLGIGPQGLGGSTTALCINIETYPRHIASLPVAVNIQCHSARQREAVI